jgi:hypothetical protein
MQLLMTQIINIFSIVFQAIWHWMDNYPEEFTDLQKKPNDDLAG